jgi:hypothetical protein
MSFCRARREVRASLYNGKDCGTVCVPRTVERAWNSRRASEPVSHMQHDDRVMRAWRTHEYGRPTDVLRLDSVAIPAPEAGELRVRVQAIPFNLNDLERITGGNMMVRRELPTAREWKSWECRRVR